jgi:hypothetical protein
MSPGGRKGEERRQHFQTYQYKVEAQYLIIFKEANTRQGGDYWNKWLIFYYWPIGCN